MCKPKSFRRGAISAALSLATISPLANAGGIMLWEIGTPTLGTASAGWAAMPEDAATAYTNPGGTVWRDTTDIRAAGQLLYGDVEFSNGGQTNISGGNGGNPLEWFPGGGAFAAGKLSENIGWGFAMAGNFGLGLDYDNDWAGRRFVQDVDLLGMSLVPSLSWKINDCLSIGAGLNIMGAYFDFESAPRAGLIENDARLRYKDTDVGYGGNLGVIYRPVPETTFGITYTSEVDLEFKDQLRLRDFGPLFEPLLDRFNDRRTEIDTTVPATVTASLQQKLTDATTFYANIAWQDWSEYAQVTIEIDNPDQTRLRVDRGYKDTGHFALGVRHKFSRGMLSDWSLSTGLAYDNSMATTATVTADTITDKAYRFGLGAGKEICPGMQLDLGYTLAWLGDVDIDQRGRPPFSPRLEGSYKNTALHFFGASVQFEM